MLAEGESIIRHKLYKPKSAIYGFIGKKFPLKMHRYYNKEFASVAREAVVKSFGNGHRELSILHQVHGNKAIVIDKVAALGQEQDADAQVTNNKNILLGIETADCVPIIFVDEVNKVVAVAHAGWRGAIAGVIDSTMKQMQKLGAEAAHTDVVIGPCIQQKCYEVGAEFFDQFMHESRSNKDFFIQGRVEGKYMFDLPGYVHQKLSHYPFKNIFDIELNTFENEDTLFSYRRDSGKGHKLEGLILSVVGISC